MPRADVVRAHGVARKAPTPARSVSGTPRPSRRPGLLGWRAFRPPRYSWRAPSRRSRRGGSRPKGRSRPIAARTIVETATIAARQAMHSAPRSRGLTPSHRVRRPMLAAGLDPSAVWAIAHPRVVAPVSVSRGPRKGPAVMQSLGRSAVTPPRPAKSPRKGREHERLRHDGRPDTKAPARCDSIPTPGPARPAAGNTRRSDRLRCDRADEPDHVAEEPDRREPRPRDRDRHEQQRGVVRPDDRGGDDARSDEQRKRTPVTVLPRATSTRLRRAARSRRRRPARRRRRRTHRAHRPPSTPRCSALRTRPARRGAASGSRAAPRSRSSAQAPKTRTRADTTAHAAARYRRVSTSQTTTGQTKSFAAIAAPSGDSRDRRPVAIAPRERDEQHDDDREVPVEEPVDDDRRRERDDVAAPVAHPEDPQRRERRIRRARRTRATTRPSRGAVRAERTAG